jgi:hypothetical protein
LGVLERAGLSVADFTHTQRERKGGVEGEGRVGKRREGEREAGDPFLAAFNSNKQYIFLAAWDHGGGDGPDGHGYSFRAGCLRILQR